MSHVPVKYAYKEEGQDVDDGVEDYEFAEHELAEVARQKLEEGIVDDDFAVDLPTVAASKAESLKTALDVIEKQISTKKLNNKPGQMPQDALALIPEIRAQLAQLMTPWTPQEIRDTVYRLKFCMNGMFFLLLAAEGRDYEGHPVVDAVNDLLVKVRNLKAVELKKNKRNTTTSKKTGDGKADVDDDVEADEEGRKISKNMMTNRGLTKTRPKDRKNPRVNQKRKYRRGVKKVSSMVRQFKPEGALGFQGVASLKAYVTKGTKLS